MYDSAVKITHEYKHMSSWRHRTYSMIETVWSSSLWISASNGCLSSDATQRHRHTSTSNYHCDRDRWDWNNHKSWTTSHLCPSLHMSMTPRRCPGLECWTSVRDVGMSVNHLHTTDSLQVHFTSCTVTSLCTSVLTVHVVNESEWQTQNMRHKANVTCEYIVV